MAISCHAKYVLTDNGRTTIQGGPEIGTIFVRLNFNKSSKLFHCQNQEKICNNTITKDPTTLQVYRYTTL